MQENYQGSTEQIMRENNNKLERKQAKRVARN